jgi:MATE family multidrug resistance protein
MDAKADVTTKLLAKKQIPKEEEKSTFAATSDVVLGAIPSTFGLLFIFIAETINIIFIGRYNQPNLISGIGIGTLYVNATGYVLGAGLIGGLDTLCSQTFGAKKYKLMGIYANIARFIVLIFFLVICIPSIIFSSTILNMLGQFSEVSDIASDFSYSMIPSLFFALQYNTSLRYLQAMKIFTPGMYITLATALLHPLWCYIFIIFFDWGVVGAGISMGLTQFFNWILVTIYIHLKNPCPESYFYWDAEVFQMPLILDYLKKGVPAAILFAADWLGFEVLTLMASYLSPLDLAANVCLLNFITLIFMIPMGLSFATTTLVGNSIGEQKPEIAKLYTKGALCFGLGMISITTMLVIIYRNSIPYVYTSEPEIANLVSGLLGIYVCFSLVDCTQIILHGAIKGLGKQKIASAICLVILYPVNIPLAYCFAFVWGFGLNGLWYSQLCSVFLLAISYILIVTLVDWNEVSKQAVAHFDKKHQGILERKSSVSGVTQGELENKETQGLLKKNIPGFADQATVDL